MAPVAARLQTPCRQNSRAAGKPQRTARGGVTAVRRKGWHELSMNHSRRPAPCTIKSTMPTPTLSREILLAALAGFQLDKQRIDTQIAEVQALLDGGGSAAASPSAAEATPKKEKAQAKCIGSQTDGRSSKGEMGKDQRSI